MSLEELQQAAINACAAFGQALAKEYIPEVGTISDAYAAMTGATVVTGQLCQDMDESAVDAMVEQVIEPIANAVMEQKTTD